MLKSDLVFLFLFLTLSGALPARADLWNTENTVSLQSESFLSQDYASTPDRNYYFLGASLISKPERHIFLATDGVSVTDDAARVSIDFRGRFSPADPVLSSFNLRELYFEQDNFALGRKLLNWSQGDEDWNLGIFEPEYRWNVLRPVSQGLTGAFVSMGERRGWKLTFFGTPFFIPDHGAGYVLQEGRFQRVSPWFQNLPAEVRLSGSPKVRQLDYQIEVPQIEKIVLNSGYAAQMIFDDPSSSSAMTVSFAYKPMNTLSLGVDGWAEAGSTAPVQIEPTVMFHRVSAADYRFTEEPITGKGFNFRVGAIHEDSEEPRDMKSNLTYVTYRPMIVGTTALGYAGRRFAVRAGYIARQGGDSVMLGPKAEELKGVMNSRLPYRRAAMLQGSYLAYRGKSRKLDLGTAWTEGVSETYSRWTADMNFSFDRSWTIWADLVLVRAEKRGSSNPDLFTSFENHDSVRAGVSYVF